MLGRVAEWVDRTDEVRAQREVAAVVHAAGARRFLAAHSRRRQDRLLGRAGALAEPAHRDLPLGAARHVAAAGGAQPGRAHGSRRASLPGPARAGVRRSRRVALAPLEDGVADPPGSENVSSVASTINEGNETLHTQGEELTQLDRRGGADHEGNHRSRAPQCRQRAAGAQDRHRSARRGRARRRRGRQRGEVDVRRGHHQRARRRRGLGDRRDRLPHQSAVAQCGGRSRACRRTRPRLRGGGGGSAQRCRSAARPRRARSRSSSRPATPTVRQGTALVASAGKTIEDVVERVATMAGVVGEIASDAQQQCLDIDAVARKISEVEISNRENAACWSRRATARANCSCWPGARRRGGPLSRRCAA